MVMISKSTNKTQISFFSILFILSTMLFTLEVFGKDRITKGLIGAYYTDSDCSELLLIRPESSEASFNTKFFEKSKNADFRKKGQSIRCVEWFGAIVPEFSESYVFDTSDNENVQVWINEVLTIDFQSRESNPIQLTADESIPIKIRYVKSDGLSALEVKWKSPSQLKSVIEKDRLRPKRKSRKTKSKKTGNHSNLIKNFLLRFVNQFVELFSPKQAFAALATCTSPWATMLDSDCDDIPDLWEPYGYIYEYGIGLRRCSSTEVNNNIGCYQTDPLQESTDGDPFDDFMEASGINMPASIHSPGDHPLVPAYPDMNIKVTNIELSPNDTITFTDGGTESDSWSKSDSTTDTSASSTAIQLSTEYETKIKASPTDPSAEHSLKIGFKCAWDWSSTNTVYSSTTDAHESATNWSEAHTTNPSEAASAIITMSISNDGNAPIYDYRPILTLLIGDEDSAKTISIDQSMAMDFAAGQTIHNFAISRQGTGSIFTEDLTLNLNQMRMVDLGYAVDLDLLGSSEGNMLFKSANGEELYSNSWKYYKDIIEGTSATINLLLDGGGIHLSRKVYASDGTSTSPQITLIDAIELLYDITANQDGTLYIYGREVTADWVFLAPTSLYYSFTTQGVDTIFDLVLEPGMEITLQAPGMGTKPVVNYAFFHNYGTEVLAYIITNGLEIESVEANYTDSRGEIHTNVPLTRSSGTTVNASNIWRLELDIPADTSHTNSTININYKDGEGNSKTITTEMLRPYDVELAPITYSKVSETTYDLSDFDDMLVDHPKAEAFVIEMVAEQMGTSDYTLHFDENGTGTSQEYAIGITDLSLISNSTIPSSMECMELNPDSEMAYTYLVHHYYNTSSGQSLTDELYCGSKRVYRSHLVKNLSLVKGDDARLAPILWSNTDLTGTPYPMVAGQRYNYENDPSIRDGLGPEWSVGWYLKPAYAPTHNTTMLIKRPKVGANSFNADFESVSGYHGSMSFKLVGVFERDPEEKPYLYHPLNNGTVSIDMDYPDNISSILGDVEADNDSVYLVKVEARTFVGDVADLILNNTTISFGNGASWLYYTALGITFNYYPIHTHYAFIPANEGTSLSNIDVSTQIGSGAGYDRNVIDDHFKITVLGVSKEQEPGLDNGYAYEPLDTAISINNFTTSEKNMFIDGNKFDETPVAFMINMSTKQISGGRHSMTVNGEQVYFGTAATVDGQGGLPLGFKEVDHSALAYVPVNADNPYQINYKYDIDFYSNVQNAVLSAKIIGYYYEVD